MPREETHYSQSQGKAPTACGKQRLGGSWEAPGWIIVTLLFALPGPEAI